MENANETVRWHWERTPYATPAEFEAVQRRKWFAPGTRNHRVGKNGIEREIYVTGNVTIQDEHHELLSDLFVGRTIVAFERELSSKHEWVCEENSVKITLDNGAVLEFVGWGYDASGVNTYYKPPPTPDPH